MFARSKLPVFMTALLLSNLWLAATALGDYAADVNALGPSVYYRLNETELGTVYDSSVPAWSAEHAFATDLSQLSPGGPGAIGDGDGYIVANGSVVDLRGIHQDALVTGTADFSVSMWVQPHDFGASDWGTYFFMGQISTHQGFILNESGMGTEDSHGQIAPGHYGVNLSPGSTGRMVLDNWNHVGFTYNADSDEAKLFLNGELDTIHDQPVNFTIGEGASCLGSIGCDGTGSQPFNGGIDEFAFFQKTLTEFEMISLSNTGNVTIPTEASWNRDGFGTWSSSSNWAPGISPDTNNESVTFGDLASGPLSAPTTVVVDNDVTIKAITFDSAVAYGIAGQGTVQLESNSGPSTLNVTQGTHEFQGRLSLNNDTNSNIAAQATLNINNSLNLNGNTLTKTGDGTLNINNQLVTGAGGTLLGNGGTISGGGTVGGDLSNNAAVAPGNSPGILSVDGNYTQSAGGTLEIELASNGGVAGTDHDRLAVTLAASLDGALDLQLDGGYTPTIGDSFTGIVTAGALSGQFATASNVVIDGRRGVAVTYTGTTVDAQIGLRGNTDIASGDIDVDTSDLTTSIINFTSAGGTGKTWADGDMDGDGDVDTSDLTTSIINFTSALGAASAAVPEPSSLILALLATFSCGCLRPRRRR